VAFDVDTDSRERNHVGVNLPELAAIEFTVADLAPCVTLFADVLGLEVTPPSRHPTLDAEVVQVNAGGVVINLLCPTDRGEGTPLVNPEPRLSQLNFVLGAVDAVHALRHRFIEAGGAVVERDASLFYIDSQMSIGVLGADATLVFSCDEAPMEERQE
jgi:hypothetical protein